MDLKSLSLLFAVVPAAFLLAISFFMLYALRNVEYDWLKVGGYVIVVILWISAVSTFLKYYRMGH